MSSSPSQPANLSSEQIEELHMLTVEVEQAVTPVIRERDAIVEDRVKRDLLESIQSYSDV